MSIDECARKRTRSVDRKIVFPFFNARENAIRQGVHLCIRSVIKHVEFFLWVRAMCEICAVIWEMVKV